MSIRILALLSVLVLGFAACGGDEEDPEPKQQNNGPHAWCTEPPAPSSPVTETQMTTEYPEATGGTIVDGTYELTRFEIYPPDSSDDSVRARLLQFDKGTIASVMKDGNSTTVIGGTYTTSGNTITVQVTCPQKTQFTLKYSVSGDEFWFQPPDENNVQVYVRQP